MPTPGKKTKAKSDGFDGVGDAPQDDFVSIDVVVSRLVLEVTENRVRHRALLDVLRTGSFEWNAYLAALRSVRERDYDALLASIVLKPEAFTSKFEPWIDGDSDRYLFELKSDVKEVAKNPKSVRPKKK